MSLSQDSCAVRGAAKRIQHQGAGARRELFCQGLEGGAIVGCYRLAIRRCQVPVHDCGQPGVQVNLITGDLAGIGGQGGRLPLQRGDDPRWI
ncbi:MAG: hypothetical protein OET63_20745 [Desulfobacterales bacterium]|nr:hypothetical protein [Desulfobacterales bacterium]